MPEYEFRRDRLPGMAQRRTRLATSTEVGAAEGSRSVRRALDIFELMLARGKPVSVAEIVAALHIPKSTTYTLVRTLSDAGYVDGAARSGGLVLGRKLFELGMAYRSQVDLLKEAAPIVEALRDATGETVQLSVLDDMMMLVLLKEEGSQSIRIISRIGSRVPVNWAAAGRLLASDFDDQPLRELLLQTVKQSPTRRATVDIDKLIAQIRRFRREGYGIEMNEANDHAGCVAAPVIDLSGRCVAAISVVVPAQRLGRDNRKRLIDAVRDAAARLSHRLGGVRDALS
jgi:DNA-binding IclR family transcriptional regulator